MEKIQALIDKLYQQKQLNSNPAQLLLTVQLLQTELLKLQQKNGTLGTSKVAVTLPVNMNFFEEVLRTSNVEAYKEEVMEIEKPVEIKIPEPPMQPSYEAKEYVLRSPVFTEQISKEESEEAYMPKQILNPAFHSSAVDTSTLNQHTFKKEIHETIAEKKESLNDRLKQEKTEVVSALKEAPIKDLRKGIGINDRFTFVNELFRGDEPMYERSIKTINTFHIFSEAEYWINRELKFKLGWNENKETVQLFYQLVRRRFS